MRRRLDLHLKSNTLTELNQLADESQFGDSKVYLCRRLIKIYASRMVGEHAKTPIKNKLLHKNYNLQTIRYTIWLSDEEYDDLVKLIDYHYYTNPQTGKPQYSIFIACLIRHQWEKKFNTETVKTNSEVKRINPDLLDPSKFPRHDNENWGGD